MLFEELGRALYTGPYLSTIGIVLPALPAELQAEVAAGETSWTLAFGPLVPDLDTADRIAIVGGDGIYELEGAEREVLETTDETRPLGVVRGGEPGRRLADTDVLEEIRHRVARGARDRGVRRRAARARVRDRARRDARAVREADRRLPGRLAPARGRVHAARARALARRSGRRGASPRTTSRRRSPRPPRSRSPPRRRSQVCETAIQVHGGIGFTWEHVLHRLYKRALWIESFAASGSSLRAEVAASLLGKPQPRSPLVTQGG